MDRWTIDIDRDDITRATVVAAPQVDLAAVNLAADDLAAGEVEFAVDLFAITANNVTYAALGQPGDLLGPDTGYWDFFGDRDAPGRLPVWGFATVTRSMLPELAPGDEFYGYWPLASHAVMRPERVGAVGFVDAMPRRQPLPGFYNRYQRVVALDDYDAQDRDLWPVYRPLYLTGWLIADQIEDAGDYGAARVFVASASSKTAMGFAHAYRQRDDRPELVGLTSPGSVAFVEGMGLYDRVIAYPAIGEEVPAGDTLLVDMAGNPSVSRAIADAVGAEGLYVLGVGKTHWDATAGLGPVDGLKRVGFFAPTRIAARSREWGGEEFRDRLGTAWRGFMVDAHRTTRIDRRVGADGALSAWRDAVAGAADPAAGIVIGK